MKKYKSNQPRNHLKPNKKKKKDKRAQLKLKKSSNSINIDPSVLMDMKAQKREVSGNTMLASIFVKHKTHVDKKLEEIIKWEKENGKGSKRKYSIYKNHEFWEESADKNEVGLHNWYEIQNDYHNDMIKRYAKSSSSLRFNPQDADD